MDAATFEQHARQDPQLEAFLREVAQDVAQQISIEEPQRFAVTGVDILLGLAAYALYRWVKDYFDHRRALHESLEVIHASLKRVQGGSLNPGS
jgi:hypothetical protein